MQGTKEFFSIVFRCFHDSPLAFTAVFTNYGLNIYLYCKFGIKAIKFLFPHAPNLVKMGLLYLPHVLCLRKSPTLYKKLILFPSEFFDINFSNLREERFFKMKLNIFYYLHLAESYLTTSQANHMYAHDLCIEISQCRPKEDLLHFLYHPLIILYKESKIVLRRVANVARSHLKLSELRKYLRYVKKHLSHDNLFLFYKIVIQDLVTSTKGFQIIKMVLKEIKLPLASFMSSFTDYTLSQMKPKVFRYFLKREHYITQNGIIDHLEIYKRLMKRRRYYSCDLAILYGATPVCFKKAKKIRDRVMKHQLLILFYCMQKKNISLYLL